MRKIIAGLFMSLDGVVEGPGPADDFAAAGWSMPYFVPEIGQYIGESGAQADALLLGRATYQGFRAAFANAPRGDPAAAMMNGISKYVVSGTLTEADWVNSTLLGGDMVEEVGRLKAQPGRNINVSGSVTLIQSLLRLGLLDGLDLLVHPVVVGQGRRLFGDGLTARLALRETRTFSSGVVLLSYDVLADPAATSS
ncbi:dihydrofolate reductase family protein [Deinococcus hopiensis]|uniref:Dihydrofolate reductase n=1 Tax=Deinococcus hopiensis KR-140 TaxID=695939 RepID=A0A1W1UHQ8_9DEIO|nr:dihydrofolate reductase family protein [Deinococcus hopiensis]SMB80562.1 Dihydrofolate reductase [Deinococcus hopiensis KR-140]